MAETIRTSETPPSSSQLNPPSRIICTVCQKQFSKYTCPRCNTRNCSLPCYKSHSLRCTESFMRENVVEELRQVSPDDETKQKMLDILKRFHSEEETDNMEDDDTNLSEETIQKILSGGQISYDDLSSREKKLFQRAVASGELSSLIEPWEPWWLKPSARTISLSQEGSQLVQPLTKQETEASPSNILKKYQLHDIPPGPEAPLPPISQLTSTKPSPLLAFHLVDISYSYCFTLRVYNGDWQSDPTGSALVVLSMSSVLGQGGQPQSLLEVMSHCVEQTCSPGFKHMGGFEFGMGLVDDVISLLSLGGSAIICMLCDLQRLVEAAEEDFKAEKRTKLRRDEIKHKLKLAKRKIYFIICWVHEQPEEAWHSLAAIVKAEKGTAMEFRSNKGGALRVENKVDTRGKPLIEEIQ